MTTVDIEYDECGCRYRFPTALADNQSVLHHAELVDTLGMLADSMHDAECPARRPARRQ